MKRLDWLLMIFSATALLISCKDDEPTQPHVPTIQLTVEDVSCTEAWLKVSLTDTNEPRTVAILQDGHRVTVSRLLSPDSVFVIEGLLPRRTYSFVAQRLRDSTAIDASGAVQATTMDTTSHNFLWQIDTLGVTSSILYDVAIVNDTLAYAVGEMYLRDSTGQIDPIRYNAAVWNGITWTVQRIPYYYQGQPFYNPIQTVFAFSPSDIWFGGNGVIHRNGQAFIPIDISSVWGPSRIDKMWGSSSNDLFIVGDGGSIAHHNGSTWQRVESGTSETINDVWGGSNTFLGENVAVMAVGWRATAGESKMLIVRESSLRADSLSWPYPLQPRRGVWFDRTSKLYTCGGGVYVSSTSIWRYISEIPSIYTKAIRGNGANDIAVSGDFGLLTHFNGTSWHVYPEVQLQFGSYESIATRGNMIVAVGWSNNRAIAIIGRR